MTWQPPQQLCLHVIVWLSFLHMWHLLTYGSHILTYRSYNPSQLTCGSASRDMTCGSRHAHLPAGPAMSTYQQVPPPLTWMWVPPYAHLPVDPALQPASESRTNSKSTPKRRVQGGSNPRPARASKGLLPPSHSRACDISTARTLF
jgi:hypothetical protein